MEFTNKDVLVAFRKELLRRKKLIEELYKYLNIYNEKNKIEIFGWDNFNDKLCINILTKKKYQYAYRHFHLCVNPTKKEYYCLNEGYKEVDIRRIAKDSEKKELFDYLDFLYSELTNQLATDYSLFNKAFLSTFTLENDELFMEYTIANDFFTGQLRNESKKLSENAILEFLNIRNYNVEQFPQYMLKLLDEAKNTDILIQPSKLETIVGTSIKSNRLNFDLKDDDNHLVLQRKHKMY